MIEKTINKYCIYIRRNLQIIKNSQTKCVKDKWFRSSLVFDTISLKQISPLTRSVILWDSQTSASHDKIIYSKEKKHTRSILCELLYVSFSLFDSNECTKILSLGEFLKKLFFINEGLWKYTLLNRHIVLEITIAYKLTSSKNKIIKYYY